MLRDCSAIIARCGSGSPQRLMLSTTPQLQPLAASQQQTVELQTQLGVQRHGTAGGA
jgi:hypothetical protein